MSDEIPPADFEEDSEDFHYVTEKYGRNFMVDTRRYFDSRLRDITQRPLDSLEENAQFEELRRSPWKLELARQMTYFARSNDPLGDPWPYERFLTKLDAAGTPLPPDLSIRSAVGEVSADLERMSRPKTPGARASGTWFEKNIARPLSEKLGTVSQGAPSHDQLTPDEFGLPQIQSSSIPPGAGSASALVDWLRGRTTDLDLETLSILHLDILRAPTLLRHEIESREQQISSTDSHAAGAHSANVLARDLATYRAALIFADAIATESATLEDLRTWLRRNSDTRDDAGSGDWPDRYKPDVLDVLSRAALASKGLAIHPEEWGEIVVSAARVYAETLGVGRGS